MSELAQLEHAVTPYEEHRDYVLAVLNRRCGWLGRDECEAVFHDAYALMLQKERNGRLDVAAMHSRQLRAYLTQTAINKALDIGKSAERTRVEPLGESTFEPFDGSAGPDEVAATSMDNARLREIVAELPERRQAIVKLRYFLDRTPEEIQRLLGISERAYRRDLERALRHVSERYALVREGRYCDSRRSLILAYVSGLAGPNRARDARDHLATCPGCTSWAVDLRAAMGRAAAILPLPAIYPTGRADRLLDMAASLRDGALQVVEGARQHVLSISTRADASAAGYASVARPGTVAAAIAGCIAVGSGATYCAVEGMPDPLKTLVTPQSAPKPEPKGKPIAAEPPPEEPSAAPVAPAATTPTPAPAVTPVAEPEPPPAEPAPAASEPAPAETEFGVEDPGPGTGAATDSGGQAQPRAPTRPAPAAGSDEFGP